jgi:hypothetical protein
MTLSCCVFFIAAYIQRTLVYFSSKYVEKHPEVLPKYVTDESIRSTMLEYKYPYEKAGLCKKIRIMEFYGAYCHLLEGNLRY